jgi:hypothetical protein
MGTRIAFILAGIAGVAAAKGKAKPKDEVTPAVKAAITAQIDAWSSGDRSHYRDGARFFVHETDQGALNADALETIRSTVGSAPYLDERAFKSLKVVTAADRQAAWASFVAYGPVPCIHRDCPEPHVFRVTELFVRSEDGTWQIFAGFWSLGDRGLGSASAVALDDQEKYEELPAPTELLDAIAVPLGKGADFADRISDRADLEVVGFADAERHRGGKAFKKVWKAWAPTLTVEGTPRGAIGPSGTAGWVAANFKLVKKDGEIWFRGLFVCEKEKAGWKVVAGHLAMTSGGYVPAE